MFRNFSLRLAARLVLGALVAANLIAALIAFKPWSGSAEDLERQAASLRSEVRKKQAALEKLSSIVSKVQTARTDGDKFMGGYLLNTRSVSSRLAGDLDRMAATASIRQKEVAFAFEPVEGSEGTLTKATMTANYEGTYADLILPYVKSFDVFKCPSDSSRIAANDANFKMGYQLKYGVNGFAWTAHGGKLSSVERSKGPNDAEIQNPGSKIAIAEGLHSSGLYMIMLHSFRRAGLKTHFDGSNFIYFDGHAKWLAQQNAKALTSAQF